MWSETTAAVTRWDRLERYARWRARRLSLHALPDDVFHLVTNLLAADDLHRLLEAFLGHVPSLGIRQHVDEVPPLLRPRWIVHVVLHELARFLHAIAERALYHARDGATVCVFADWSPYARHRAPPLALAEYAWLPGGRAHVQIHAAPMRGVVERGFKDHLPTIHVTMHTLLHWNGRATVFPRPHLLTSYLLYPAFLLHPT